MEEMIGGSILSGSINAKIITTGKIKNKDGKVYFNLDDMDFEESDSSTNIEHVKSTLKPNCVYGI